VDVEGLLAALSNPALVVAGDDAIVSVNDAFCCSFGVESDHTAGRSWTGSPASPMRWWSVPSPSGSPTLVPAARRPRRDGGPE